MKGKAVVLVALVLLALAPAAFGAAQGGMEHRSPGIVEVKLYTQLSTSSATLSTSPSTAFIRPRITSLEFTGVDLTRDLKVEGGALYVGGYGFLADIEVQAPLTSTSNAAVTVEVLDDGTVIARSQNTTVVRGDSKTVWEIPLIGGKTSYNFARNRAISLRIGSDIAVHVQTDTDSYLSLRCLDHLGVDVETRDTQDKRVTNFYPNDVVDNRQIVFRGAVKDPFGGDDVARVNVSVRRPDGTVALEPTAAQLTGLNYSYTWAYPSGLPPGRYNIDITGHDLQNHPFSTTGTFTMAEYGLRITAEGEESGRVTKSTTPGVPARYPLTVTNIGGRQTQVQMDSGASVKDWTAAFSRTTFTLDAGQDDDVTFEATPAEKLGGGNESRYILTATASSDPSTPKASDTIEAETFVRNTVAFTILPEKPDAKTVGVGGSVDHTFTLRNSGEFTTDVDLTLTGVPTGWTATLLGSRVSNNAVEDLTSMEVVDITLRVGAPSSSSASKVDIKVRCTSREYPSTYAEVTLTTNLVIGVALRPTPPLSFTQDPNTSFTIYFSAWNPDPQRVHNITFTVSQKNTAWNDRTAFKFTPSNTVQLQPDPRGTSPSSLGLEVSVPSDAGAGTFRFTVKGEVDGNANVYASFDFNVTISVRRVVTWEADLPDPPMPLKTDDPAVLFFTVRNDGNVVETVNITVTTDADWVKIWINDAPGGLLSNLRLQPGDGQQVKVSLQADKAARNKDEATVRVQMRSADNPNIDRESDIKVQVEKSSSQVFMEFLTTLGPLTALVAATAIVVLSTRRRRSKAEDEGDEDEKDEGKGKQKAQHGTLVRQ